MTRKIRLGVLFGGRSGEHEVSINSARSLLAAVDREKYDLIPVGITRSGRWLLADSDFLLTSEAESVKSGAELVADLAGHGLVSREEVGIIRPAEGMVDVVFPLLHGPYGEDGTVQGVLELSGVAYVGAGVAASAVAMDKSLMKAMFEHAGLEGPAYRIAERFQWLADRDAVVTEIAGSLGFPCFVKPARLGSSVGISKAHSIDELYTCVGEAFGHDLKIIVEEGIDGREIECGVIGNHHLSVSMFGEVVPKNEFYDYESKYTEGMAELIIPAPLSSEQVQAMSAVAQMAFRAVDAAGMARVDFFLERDTERIVLNEINTIPGFTRTSMFPKLWEASGIGYSDLVDRLVELALERQAEVNSLE